MIQGIVNNNQNDVQISTLKAENSQENGISFAEIIAQTFVSRVSSNSANLFTEDNLVPKNEEVSEESPENSDIFSLILLNNNIMQMLKNNHNLGENQISEFINENNIESIDINKLKEIFDGIKAAYNPKESEYLSKPDFLSNQEFSTRNIFSGLSTTDTENQAESIQVGTGNNQAQDKNSILSYTKQTTAINNIQNDDNIEQINSVNKIEFSASNKASETDSNLQSKTKDSLQLSKSAEEISKNITKNDTTIVQTKAESTTTNQGNSQFNSGGGENNANSQSQRNDLEYKNSSNVNNSELKKQNESYSKLSESESTKLQAAFAAGVDNSSELSEGKTVNSEYDKNARINIRELPRYIDKMIKTMPSNSTHQAKINLEPGNLGKVSIEISISGNNASISFKAENADAAKMLESQLAGLKDKLSAGGIKVESASVEYKNSDSNGSQLSKDSHSQSNNSREEQQTKRQYLGIFEKHTTNSDTQEFNIPIN